MTLTTVAKQQHVTMIGKYVTWIVALIMVQSLQLST